MQRTTRDEKWFFSVAKLIQVRVCVMNVYGKDEEEDKKKTNEKLQTLFVSFRSELKKKN